MITENVYGEQSSIDIPVGGQHNYCIDLITMIIIFRVAPV